MNPLQALGQVFDAIQQAKGGAPDFCTNFFPVQRRLQEWIDRQELFGDFGPETAFFFRKDRDFWHHYFCAASISALKRGIACLPELKAERVVLDLVGNESALAGLRMFWESAGFRTYTRLCRMARANPPDAPPPAGDDPRVAFAAQSEGRSVLELLEQAFDRYGEQLPTLYEIEAAVAARQVLVARHDGKIAGLLFFETQGFSSTLRFWTVAPQFRALRFGSALMRQYFAAQKTVRRFVLWVAMDNAGAVQKYQHYGYAPDGLVDYVLANEMIPA